MTNRVSSKSQSNIAYHSKSFKETNGKQNVSIGYNQKENSGRIVSKAILEKNNNVLILEINVFRLLFKIYEKVKKYASEEKELLNTIGN